jgi:hypothetical protein
VVSNVESVRPAANQFFNVESLPLDYVSPSTHRNAIELINP